MIALLRRLLAFSPEGLRDNCPRAQSAGPDPQPPKPPATNEGRRPTVRLCAICSRRLDTGDPLSVDCGGDCWACVRDFEHPPEPRSPLTLSIPVRGGPLDGQRLPYTGEVFYSTQSEPFPVSRPLAQYVLQRTSFDNHALEYVWERLHELS